MIRLFLSMCGLVACTVAVFHLIGNWGPQTVPPGLCLFVALAAAFWALAIGLAGLADAIGSRR